MNYKDALNYYLYIFLSVPNVHGLVHILSASNFSHFRTQSHCTTNKKIKSLKSFHSQNYWYTLIDENEDHNPLKQLQDIFANIQDFLNFIWKGKGTKI